MQKVYWSDKETKDLLEDWKNRPADINTKDFSIYYSQKSGRSPLSVQSKIRTMPEFNIPPSNRTPWDTPPILEGDAFVILDTQIPFHHAEFINKCLVVCERWKIRQMIIGGDALDMNALSTFTPNFESESKRVIDYQSASELAKFAEKLPSEKREELFAIIGEAEQENNFSGEIKESRTVLRAFEKSFDHILWIMGNHEQRILKILQKVLPVETLGAVFGVDNPKWTISPYYWCLLKSGGEEWQIEHPINTGKGSSKRLAPKFGKHIIMGHNHHFNITTDPSGRYYTIEPGMGMDETRMAYASQRHNAADMHVVGAVIIRNGKPTPLNKFTDWDMLK